MTESPETNKTLSIAIVSGKGGVGKTNIALNLGFALHQQGHSLVLLDADLGLANLDVLLGLSPEKNLQDLLAGENPDNIVVPLAPEGFDFLPSASGVAELVELDEDIQGVLMHKLDSLFRRYDFLLLDLGAGINPTVLAFAAMPQERVIVITPEPTSLTDSYALIKVLSTQHNVRNFHIVVNMAETTKEGQTAFNRLAQACERFLNLPVRLLGIIHRDPMVTESVRHQVPLLKFAPTCQAAQDICDIAQKIAERRSKLAELIARSPVLKSIV
ncbi:MAG: MinD/ParA family protein [Desulfovibrionales bacterium]|nr:MinD/ParA family protein [Desulfovibrionales bacterium]